MIVPEKGTAAAFVPEISEDKIEWPIILEYMKQRQKYDLTFVLENGHWTGNVDSLAFDVEFIAEWLKQNVINNTFDEISINRCLIWIEEELNIKNESEQ